MSKDKAPDLTEDYSDKDSDSESEHDEPIEIDFSELSLEDQQKFDNEIINMIAKRSLESPDTFLKLDIIKLLREENIKVIDMDSLVQAIPIIDDYLAELDSLESFDEICKNYLQSIGYVPKAGFNLDQGILILDKLSKEMQSFKDLSDVIITLIKRDMKIGCQSVILNILSEEIIPSDSLDKKIKEITKEDLLHFCIFQVLFSIQPLLY